MHIWKVIFTKKSLKIPKGQSESVDRRGQQSESVDRRGQQMPKRKKYKRTNNDLQYHRARVAQ